MKIYINSGRSVEKINVFFFFFYKYIRIGFDSKSSTWPITRKEIKSFFKSPLKKKQFRINTYIGTYKWIYNLFSVVAAGHLPKKIIAHKFSVMIDTMTNNAATATRYKR